MAEILWCNRPVRADELEKECAIPFSHVTGMGCAKPSMLLPYQPYLVGRRPTRHDQAILARLQPLPRALVGGVAVAGVAAATSIGATNYLENNSGSWYDAIMEWIGSR